MGYACPVCDIPQRDGEHLAHHLAFTAMLHGGDHEAWLADRAPDWESASPEELANVVVEDAEETEYHEVFEDTTNRTHGHDGPFDGGRGHDAPFDEGLDAARARQRGRGGAVSEETREIIEDAQELTREMYDASDESENAGNDEPGDASGSDEPGDANGSDGA